MTSQAKTSFSHNIIGLFLGPFVAISTFWFYYKGWYGQDEAMLLSTQGATVISIMLLMAIWWLTEAVSISVTSLLPLVLLPFLNVSSIQDAASPYASPAIYLFLGGFIVAKTFEKWDLHKRLAYWLITTIGFSPTKLLASFMLVPLILSMWMNNSSTTLLILPMVIVVIQTVEQQNKELQLNIPETFITRFKTFVCLTVCYSASIGGVGTPIGTAPNIILQGFLLENYGIEIDMILWLSFSLPLLLLICPLLFIYMGYVRGQFHKIVLPQDQIIKRIQKSKQDLGPWSKEQRFVLIIFLITAFSWIFKVQIRDFLGIPYINDASIAMTAAILLFTVPMNLSKQPFLITWDEAKTLPWGVLMIIGGGMSLSAAIQSQGVSQFIGYQLLFVDGLSYTGILIVLLPLIAFSSEITSNAALTSAMLPIVAQLAEILHLDPVGLMLPCATAASFAFMLPSATPPNAIIYGTGYFSLARMAKIGFFANLLASICLIVWSSIWFHTIYIHF